MGSRRRLDRVHRRQPDSPLRGALEERDQLVGGLECAAPQMRRNDRFHGVELLCRSGAIWIAVGTRITERPPHRSVCAACPQTAPSSGGVTARRSLTPGLWSIGSQQFEFSAFDRNNSGWTDCYNHSDCLDCSCSSSHSDCLGCLCSSNQTDFLDHSCSTRKD